MEWQIRITPAETPDGSDDPAWDWAVHRQDDTGSRWSDQPVVSGSGEVSFDDVAYWMDQAGYDNDDINDVAISLGHFDLIHQGR